MIDGLMIAVSAILWAASAHRAWLVSRRRTGPSQRALLVTFLGLAAGITLFSPGVHASLTQITGVANIADPLARVAVLVAAWAAQVVMLYLTRETPAALRKSRGLLWVLVPTQVTMLCLFVISAVDTQTSRFTSDYGADPVVEAYLGVFIAYLCFAATDVMLEARRYAHVADAPLATGLRLVGAGCGMGLAYAAIKLAALLGLAIGSPLPVELESVFARASGIVGGVLVAVGCSWPAVAAALLDAWPKWRAHRRLYPLWWALYRATPTIALDPAGSPLMDALRVRDINFRLYRRVIEIRDARLVLKPYLDGGLARQARSHATERGLSGLDADAAVEALVLRTAIEAAKRGSRPQERRETQSSVGASLDDEVTWLLRVAKYFESPLTLGPQLRSPSDIATR